MSVKLKVLHGAIKKRGKWQLAVPIRKSPFVIGQASDCNMRCFGQTIRDYHCEIRVEGNDVLICNLDRRSQTLINGELLRGARRFLAGEHLQLGRLTFELLIELPQRSSADFAFDDYVSDLLVEADAAHRSERADAPDQRWYQIEPVPTPDPYEGMSRKERLIAKARTKLPPKQSKPGKLPKRKYIAPTTTDAVAEGLAMYYQGIDSHSPGWVNLDE